MKSNACSIRTAAARAARSAAFCGIVTVLGAVSGMAQTPAPILPFPPPAVSTVPANGDVNPYGVLFVPFGISGGGVLQPGDILVSNFNNAQNLQGTGTTIIRVDRAGKVSTFFQGQPGLGLTAALGILRSGVVVVGNLPTADGTSATAKAGSLLFIDGSGKLLGALGAAQGIAGPWGLAIHDNNEGAAQIFVSNVLNGTIVRYTIRYDAEQVALVGQTTLLSGLTHRTDPAALVLGPSGLFYDGAHDVLYNANSAVNAIYALPNASTVDANAGVNHVITTDAVHLHGPLDVVLAPNGHLLVANSDGSNATPAMPSEIVEYTVHGQFVAQFSVDPNNGGAFGLNFQNVGGAVRFAAVDDNTNMLQIYTTIVHTDN